MKNSTTGQNNIRRDRASDVHHRPRAWQPSFEQFGEIHRQSPIEPALAVVPGVLFQPSNLNLDAWKQSAGIFPLTDRYCAAILCCDTVLRAIETFKTSIELIDRAQKPIQCPETRRGEIKILDPSSRSPIHLSSKSKI